MGTKKKEEKTEPVTPINNMDGVIDPYAAGKHIANPEPNNGRGEALVEEESVTEPTSDKAEQAAVAKGRKEK